MRKEPAEKQERMMINELIVRSALLSHDAAFELSQQYSLSKVLGDTSIDPALTRELLRKAIEILERNTDDLVQLAVDSRIISGPRLPSRVIVRLVGSFLLATILGTALIVGYFCLLDYIDPPKKLPPNTEWIMTVREAKP
jgi:hypothetical protein